MVLINDDDDNYDDDTDTDTRTEQTSEAIWTLPKDGQPPSQDGILKGANERPLSGLNPNRGATRFRKTNELCFHFELFEKLFF